MIEETGRVVAIDGELAQVEVGRRSACGGCSAKSGCGTSLLAEWFPSRKLMFVVRNDIGARCGDAVTIGLEERRLQNASLLLYGAPLIGLVGGAILGDALASTVGFNAELMAVLTGLLGLSGALALVRGVSRNRRADGSSEVKLVRINRTSVDFVT
jgi:sigma-E factor negative regulatory protein RseC